MPYKINPLKESVLITFLKEVSEVIKRSQDVENECYTNDEVHRCFGQIRKQISLQKHGLELFFGKWKSLKHLSTQELSDLSGNCMELQRRTFVMSMGIIEWNVREEISSSSFNELKRCLNHTSEVIEEFDVVYSNLCKKGQEKLQEIRKKIKKLPTLDPITRIIEKSKSLDLIDQDTSQAWTFLVKIRNWAIHNGGKPDKDQTLTYRGKNYNFQKNQEIQAILGYYTELSFEAKNCFKIWLEGFKK